MTTAEITAFVMALSPKYAEYNPKFYSITQQRQQDPMGAHAWLEAVELRKREGQ